MLLVLQADDVALERALEHAVDPYLAGTAGQAGSFSSRGLEVRMTLRT
jgi:hypothetical protein